MSHCQLSNFTINLNSFTQFSFHILKTEKVRFCSFWPALLSDGVFSLRESRRRLTCRCLCDFSDCVIVIFSVFILFTKEWLLGTIRWELFWRVVVENNALIQIISCLCTTFKYRHFHPLWHLCRLELIYAYGKNILRDKRWGKYKTATNEHSIHSPRHEITLRQNQSHVT